MALKNSNNYEFLTFIPAKSTSIGIKNKNLKRIGKYTLIEYTLNFLKKVNLKKNFIYVSTDSTKYLNSLKKFNLGSLLLRSKKNSKSNSKLEDSIFEFLNHPLIKKQNFCFKYLILLLPTQPFRNHLLFKKAINSIKNNTKSIISIKNLDRSSDYIFKVNSDKIKIKKKLKSTNRQFVKTNYTSCGCFYIIKFSEFIKHKSLFIPKSNYLISNFPDNIDIDSSEDLKIANLLYKNKNYFRFL